LDEPQDDVIGNDMAVQDLNDLMLHLWFFGVWVATGWGSKKASRSAPHLHQVIRNASDWYLTETTTLQCVL
jgi:hypothetical protein